MKFKLEMSGKLYIDMQYNMNSNSLTITDTNIKRGRIDDVFEWWLRDQQGKGADERKANEKDIYHLKLEGTLQYDHFELESDVGNDGLATGIIITSLSKWKFSPELEDRIKKAEEPQLVEKTETPQAKSSSQIKNPPENPI